jgi:hypothetical protein
MGVNDNLWEAAGEGDLAAVHKYIAKRADVNYVEYEVRLRRLPRTPGCTFSPAGAMVTPRAHTVLWSRTVWVYAAVCGGEGTLREPGGAD